MKTYYVYMLRCFDGTFYVGVTNDVEYRFGQHMFGTDPKAYTYTRRPLVLVHVSEFRFIDEAINWEKRLKGWSHRKKRALAERDWRSVQHFAGATGYEQLQRN